MVAPAPPDPFAPAAQADPHPVYARLRRESPVHPITLPDGSRLWLVTRHADVDAALRDGFSTYAGLGLGLPGTVRLVDELTIESEPGVGTTVTATKWTSRPQKEEPA